MSAEFRDDSDRLKPCPFCGGEAEWNHCEGDPAKIDDPMAGATWIDCLKCGASTNLRYSLMDDCRPLLLEQWNRRATPTPPEPVKEADVSDEEIIAVRKATRATSMEPWSDSIAFARAVLALRGGTP